MKNSQELFLLETLETIFDVPTYLYLIDGRKIFYKNSKDKEYIKAGYNLELNSEINKKSVYNFVKGYFSYSIRWNGTPTFNSAGYLNKDDLESIVSEIKDEAQAAKKEGLKTANYFIDFLESKSLDPRPTGNSKYSWQANCPFSGGSHFMMISTETNTFGCGWCKKKGDQKYLKDYLQK